MWIQIILDSKAKFCFLPSYIQDSLSRGLLVQENFSYSNNEN